MNIAIIEANMTGLQHAYVNSLTISAIQNMDFVSTIELYCSESQFSNIQLKTNEKISYHSIYVEAPGKKRVKKFFHEYSITKSILKSTNYDVYIFLSCFPNVQFFLINILKRYPNKKVILFNHGELEGLVMKGKWKFWSYPFWISITFRKKDPANITRIVLGKSIKDNIEKLGYDKNIKSIKHPLLPGEEYSLDKVLKTISFGYIGTCLKQKGGNTFYNAAKYSNLANNFFVIGKSEVKSNGFVKCLSEPGKMLTKKEYESSICNITYACFPYPSNSYKFTASGALLDAIRYCKPIIYIGNDYFNDIFSKANDIGFFCKNEDDFITTIDTISKNFNKEQYKKQCENIKVLRQKFLYEEYNKDLIEIVKGVVENE